MSEIGKKVVGFLSQLVLLPVYAITWVLGSPYLMTLLCIMSEVLVELVVSAVMAGVSLVVSAVILMEDDDRPLINEHGPKFLDSNECETTKPKSTSTKSLERINAERCAEKARKKAEAEAAAAAEAAALLEEECEDETPQKSKEGSDVNIPSKEGSKLKDVSKEGSGGSVTKSPQGSGASVTKSPQGSTGRSSFVKPSSGERSPVKQQSIEKSDSKE